MWQHYKVSFQFNIETSIFLLSSLLPYITDYYIIHSSQFMLHVKEGILGWATGSSTGSLHSKGAA
jgi:hypothetical protein